MSYIDHLCLYLTTYCERCFQSLNRRRFWVAACCSVGLLQLIECVCFTLFCLQAVRLLKRGGVLVYSTCTVTLAENEEQVVWALKTFPCLTLEPQVRIKTLPKQQTFYIPERSKLSSLAETEQRWVLRVIITGSGLLRGKVWDLI